MSILEKIQALRQEVQEAYDLETNPVAQLMDNQLRQLERMQQHNLEQ